MAKFKMPRVKENPFEPRPPIQPIGDADPRKLVNDVGSITTAWEMTEISYSYLFNMLVRPQIYSAAIRRAWGSVVSGKSRREIMEGAAEVFFHNFPDMVLEREFADYMNIYSSGAARRNDVAHGIITNEPPQQGWYLSANRYSNKRDVNFVSPYAYTHFQLLKMGQAITWLRADVDAFRDTLKEHFQSCDPKLRARY